MCPSWANLRTEWRRLHNHENKFRIVFIKPPLIIIYCIANLSKNLILLDYLSNVKRQSFRYRVWNNIIAECSTVLFTPSSYSNSKSNSWNRKDHRWTRVGSSEQDVEYNLRRFIIGHYCKSQSMLVVFKSFTREYCS